MQIESSRQVRTGRTDERAQIVISWAPDGAKKNSFDSVRKPERLLSALGYDTNNIREPSDRKTIDTEKHSSLEGG